MLRKLLSILIITILTFSLFACSLTVHAEEDCTVTVETVSALTGDEVYVHLNVTNNPGIMAMTISITYNPDALDYIDYYYGDVFSDYTVAAHPTRKLIRLVISEKKDISEDGIIASFKFKVKDNAENELHKMTVEYSSGDFCNNDLVRIMPKIVSGGVDVQYNGSNCSHKNFGEWTEKVAPSCDKEGVEQRTCVRCPHTENRSTNPIGHEFSDKWTIDIPATKDMPGTMSRHCIRCSATTNETNFTLEDTEEGKIDNTPEAEVPENDVVSDIIEEQHPDIDDQINSENNSSGNNSSKDNTTSENTDKDNSSDSTSNQTTDSNTQSSDDDSDENNNTSSDSSDISKEEEEKKKNEDKIKDIIEIISPEDEAPQETALTVAEKLREVIPEIDKVIGGLRIAFTILFILILI